MNNIEEVSINSLDNGNNQQRDFLKQIDAGVPILETNYYRRLKSYRQRTGSKQQIWSAEKLLTFMIERIDLYLSIKLKGMLLPIIVGKQNRITDGNHRHDIMKHLGHRTIKIRREE